MNMSLCWSLQRLDSRSAKYVLCSIQQHFSALLQSDFNFYMPSCADQISALQCIITWGNFPTSLSCKQWVSTIKKKRNIFFIAVYKTLIVSKQLYRPVCLPSLVVTRRNDGANPSLPGAVNDELFVYQILQKYQGFPQVFMRLGCCRVPGVGSGWGFEII